MENSAIANDSCSNITNNNSSSCKMYKGVRKRKWGKWVSEIRLPNSRERIWLGSHDTQEKAARAFDAALYCLRGKSANFNFPNTPLTINLDPNVPHHSLTHQEIQEVAAKFANDPPLESVREEQSSESQSGVDSFGLFESNNTSNYDGTLQVDHDTSDWTFFNTLDDLNNEVAPSDFGLYFGPEKMHSGEFLLSTQQPLLFEDNNGGEFEGDDDHDAFSNHSFLWSWNF